MRPTRHIFTNSPSSSGGTDLALEHSYSKVLIWEASFNISSSTSKPTHSRKPKRTSSLQPCSITTRFSRSIETHIRCNSLIFEKCLTMADASYFPMRTPWTHNQLKFLHLRPIWGMISIISIDFPRIKPSKFFQFPISWGITSNSLRQTIGYTPKVFKAGHLKTTIHHPSWFNSMVLYQEPLLENHFSAASIKPLCWATAGKNKGGSISTATINNELYKLGARLYLDSIRVHKFI